jgi:RNA polymerase sigma-70 factor, ECF subfamily
MPSRERVSDVLLSDEPTLELVVRAKQGDALAVEALLQRCLPALTRWAHGRLPPSARGSIDTADLVQEAAIHVVRRLDTFEPRTVGSMQAYLRQSVLNRIRDEIRRVSRRPASPELNEQTAVADRTPSPLDVTISLETYKRYRSALGRLRPRDRELVVARVEAQWQLRQIQTAFGLRTADAARMAVNRALNRLKAQVQA